MDMNNFSFEKYLSIAAKQNGVHFPLEIKTKMLSLIIRVFKNTAFFTEI